MYKMFSVNIVSVLVTYSDIEKLFVVLQSVVLLWILK